MSVASDAIVIGGGVIGLAVADRLRRAGLSVVLLERGSCGREASWAAVGILKPTNPNRHGPMAQLQRAALDAYPRFCADLHERTGIDPQYKSTGSIELLFDDQRCRMARSEQQAAATTPDGRPEWKVLTPTDARQIETALSGECLAALLCRVTAQVHNPLLLDALMAACRAGGVRIVEQMPVTGLAIRNERVLGAVAGSTQYVAGHVVLCAGAWTSRIDARLGAAVQTHPVRGQAVLLDITGCPAAKFERVLDRKGCYLVPRGDDQVLVGTTIEPESGFSKRNTAAAVAKLLSLAAGLVPALESAGVAGMWAGLRPGTPDHRPYLGPVPGFDGLIAATGHYRTGLALAPVTADIVADLIVKGTPRYDLALWLPGRAT
ncbi:MAG: glycine oxidase ThiO [bacterium]|nr:glycine oxidase ThiO [bacterium]